MKIKKTIVAILLTLGGLYFVVTQTVPGMIEKSKGSTKILPSYEVSEKTESFYSSLEFVADLHCDALLWSRGSTQVKMKIV